MLLAIDCGNTNMLFALHDGKDWVARWRVSTQTGRTADEYAVWLSQLFVMHGYSITSISRCIVSTVVPQSIFHLRNLAKRYFDCPFDIIGDGACPIGIEVNVNHPNEVGADRLVTAVGAKASFDPPLIIVDSGTATTFDVIAKDGSFVGGIIAPGLNLSLIALNEAAAKLPRIEIKKPEQVVGHHTVGAMQSGIYWGYVSLIDGLIEKIKKERGEEMKVIGTGGVASLFEGSSEHIDHFDHDLTINGLRIIAAARD